MRKPTHTAAPAVAQEAEILALLEGHRFLRLLAPEALRTLIRQSFLHRFGEKDLIFAQGDPGSSVMVVVDGFVKLSSSTVAGREVLLEVAGPGAVFGELAVLNDWPRSADATPLSACRLLAIDGPSFVHVLAEAPSAMFEIIRLVSERLRSTTEQMTDGLDLPAAPRLAKALTRLAAQHSHAVKGGLRIDVQLTQRELGSLTGLTRESINKHLSQWRDLGWVALSDRYVTVRNPQRLQDVLREHVETA